MKKIIALALAVLCVAACLVACGTTPAETKAAPETTAAATEEAAETEAAVAETKTYKFVSDTAFSPFEYLDVTTNTYVGFDMDLLAAIAEDQGFAYTMENVGFDPALAAVLAGQADAFIAGATITEKRMETYDFSDGYFEDGQILVVAANSDIDALEDLNGKVVATKTGTMGREFAEEHKETYGYTTIAFESSTEMYMAVVQGQAAACFEDRSVAADAINKGLELKLVGDVINPSFYGIGVLKGANAELIAMVNAGLENLKANGKYEEILAKYGM